MKQYFLLAIVAAVLSFVIFNRAYLRATAKIRPLLIVAALVLSIPALMYAGNQFLFIPSREWFWEVRVIDGIEASIGLIGGLVGILFASSRLRPSKLNRYILVFCTLLSAMLIARPFVPQVFENPDYAAMRSEWQEGVCLQSTLYTCVPACASTIIKMQGGDVSEEKLAEAMQTSSHGTEYWYMKRGLRKLGYEATRRWCNSVKDAPKPCVLGVTVSGMGHVVVLLETNETGVVIGEPLRGKRKYKWEVFNKCYEPNGTYTVIKPIKNAQ